MSIPRRVARTNAPTTLHEDSIRLGRAVIMPGQWEQHDPFLALMNDRFGAGAFGPHPHRGFETISYVLDGQLAHTDNLGGSGILNPGDVQWMTAGRGVVHDEQPAGEGQVHMLQLWLNLPAEQKLATPRYQDLRGDRVPIRREPGVEVRVFAGQSGEVTGAAQTHLPVTMLDIRLDAGSHFSAEVPAGDNTFVYVIRGEGHFGADAVEAGSEQILWFERIELSTAANEASTIRIEATSNLHVLLLSGPPLNEPVAAYGPFVMNTQQQVVEAIQDYQRTGFAAAA